MRAVLLRYWCARLATIAVLTIIPSWHPVRDASPRATPLVVLRHDSSELPPVLQASLSREGVTLVSAIAADIDADGDLDVVGSDDHLALVVLVNDGQGHLSRRSSRRPTEWSSDPTDPVMHDPAAASNVPVQNDPPSLRAGVTPQFRVHGPSTFTAHNRPDAPAGTSLSIRVPRAPPLLRS